VIAHQDGTEPRTPKRQNYVPIQPGELRRGTNAHHRQYQSTTKPPAPSSPDAA